MILAAYRPLRLSAHPKPSQLVTAGASRQSYPLCYPLALRETNAPVRLWLLTRKRSAHGGGGSVLASHILTCHNGTAGGKGGKELDEEVREGVDEGDSAHCALPDVGNHYRVCHSDCQSENLLNEQRDYQSLQEPFFK